MAHMFRDPCTHTHILNSGACRFADTRESVHQLPSRQYILLRHVDRSWNYQQAYTKEEYSSSDGDEEHFYMFPWKPGSGGSSEGVTLHTVSSSLFSLSFLARRYFIFIAYWQKRRQCLINLADLSPCKKKFLVDHSFMSGITGGATARPQWAMAPLSCKISIS
jgi:hypothetical protein